MRISKYTELDADAEAVLFVGQEEPKPKIDKRVKRAELVYCGK
jgi:hypothetical protein